MSNTIYPYKIFFGEWHSILCYEKHSVGDFCSPDTLVKLPQFICEISLPGDFFIAHYEVSIFLIHPSYGVDDIIGLHGCDEICGQREFSCLCTIIRYFWNDPSSENFWLKWTNVHIPRILHWISFLNYPQTIFQELQKYTNRHSHQHHI